MSFQSDPRTQVVWISKSDPIPDTCCQCGAFTYDRVTVKHVEEVYSTKQGTDGCVPVVLGLFLHLLLGPIGWLIEIAISGDDKKAKLVKKKSKFKIAQCQVCQVAGPPQVFEMRDMKFGLVVHPKFETRLEEEIAKLADEESRRSLQ